jgi:acyl dehydratase
VRIKKVAIKLGAPNFAGDTLHICGQVIAVDPANATAELRLSGRNSVGEHVAATVTVILPGVAR